VPLFDAFRQNPADLHLLRVAYGGMMGGITNIAQTASARPRSTSWPDMMQWDAITGDYGMGFYGHALPPPPISCAIRSLAGWALAAT
jgi:hypothetical protein